MARKPESELSFSEWMELRIGRTLATGIIDPETKDVLKVSEAKTPVLEALTEKRAEFFRTQHGIAGAIIDKAGAQARADKSDPFTYDRVLSHFKCGFPMSIDDYQVDFRPEQREYTSHGETIRYSVDVPVNMKRP